MNVIMTPCFYCKNPAEYSSLAVEKIKDKFEVVDVCKDHFVFAGTS
jgi:hypothetical protein